MITVHVVSAHGLPAARAHDLNGLADPYLSISVGERKLQSRVMKSTLEPRFEQTFELYTEDCCDASGELHSLHVRVLDKDRTKQADLLAECSIPLATALGHDDQWEEPLHPKGKLVLRVAQTAVPAHLLAKGQLVVHLVDAEGLPPADPISRSADPYVKLACGGQQHRSRVISRTLKPRWDQTLAFSGRLHELAATALHLRVCDQARSRPHARLPPQARLPPHARARAGPHVAPPLSTLASVLGLRTTAAWTTSWARRRWRCPRRRTRGASSSCR
jgi:Ca2+-dependent lipid-binding protein